MATLKVEALGLEEVGPQTIKLDLTSDAALKKSFKTNADKLDYIVKGAEGLDPLVIGLMANYSVSFDEVKDLGEAVAEYGENMVSAAIAYSFEEKGIPGVLETLNKAVVKGPFNSVSEFAAAELADFNFERLKPRLRIYLDYSAIKKCEKLQKKTKYI